MEEISPRQGDLWEAVGDLAGHIGLRNGARFGLDVIGADLDPQHDAQMFPIGELLPRRVERALVDPGVDALRHETLLDALAGAVDHALLIRVPFPRDRDDDELVLLALFVGNLLFLLLDVPELLALLFRQRLPEGMRFVKTAL